MSDADQELYTDIIITAVEGGINYWAEVQSYHVELEFLGDSRNHAYAVIVDEATGRVYYLHPLRVKAALDKLRVESPYAYARTSAQALADTLDDRFLDSVSADQVIQILCFGEVIYG